jgi:hypothetical protein
MASMIRNAGDVRDHIVDLDIHLSERFLNMQDVLGTDLHEILAVPQQTANGANGLRGAKTRAQKANRVEILQPLGIAHVRLAAGHVLDVS